MAFIVVCQGVFQKKDEVVPKPTGYWSNLRCFSGANTDFARQELPGSLAAALGEAAHSVIISFSNDLYF
jgi:hypothetical protein